MIIKTKTTDDDIYYLYREDGEYVIYTIKNILKIQKMSKIEVFKEKEEAIKRFEELG